MFGVWIDGKEVLTGALGEQVTGVPTTRDVHFRLGNTGETMMTTLLLRLVDQGKLALDDPISKWYPDLPSADQVTLQMLASSTSGYADYATTDEFNTRLHANPFQKWEPDELLAIAMRQPPVSRRAPARRAGHQLGVLRHQLPHPRTDPATGERQAVPTAGEGPGTRQGGAVEHVVPDHLRDPRPRPALVHERAGQLRGSHVLEPIRLPQQRQRAARRA